MSRITDQDVFDLFSTALAHYPEALRVTSAGARGLCRVHGRSSSVSVRLRACRVKEEQQSLWWQLSPQDLDHDFLGLYAEKPNISAWFLFPRTWMSAQAERLKERGGGGWDVHIRGTRGWEMYRTKMFNECIDNYADADGVRAIAKAVS